MADDEPEFAAAFNEGMISDRTRRRNRCLRPFCGMRLALDVAGVADRTAVVGGSFFESVPLGGDAYVLKDIVHDWDESKVLEILRNVRNAVSAGAKLLVIETVIHPTTIASSCPNCWIWKCWSPAPGKERTAAEYTHLLNRAGFCNMRVIPTVGPVSVVESEAA